MTLPNTTRTVLAASLATLFSAFAAAQDADRELAVVRVQAAPEKEFYQADIATTATRIKVPLRDVPQTVNVVTESLIADQGARSLNDVMRNVPGVSSNLGDGQRDQFYIRGFDAIGDQFIDGLRDDALYYRDLSNIERVEVVKGPAAVLYGRGSSGGVINRITRKPTAAPVREMELVVGAFDEKRASFDWGGALNDTASFRVTGAVEDSGSFRSQGFLERENIAPSLALHLTPNTQLIIQVEKLSDRRVTDMGVPAVNGRPADVPLGTYYGSSDARRDDYSQATVTSGRITLDHKFNADWSLHNQFGSYSYHLDRHNTNPNNNTVNPTTLLVGRNHGDVFRQDDGWFNQFELTQNLNAAGARHQLLYGVEIGKQKKDLLNFNRAVAGSVSVFNPALVAVGTSTAGLTPSASNLTALDVRSLYVQDLLTLSQHWKALLGARHDLFEQSVQDRKAGTSFGRTDREWSPRAGVVFQPDEWQSYYVSYSRSFQPSGETLAFSSAQSEMAPEETRNIEVGTKVDLFAGRVSVTGSLFELERTNIKNVVPGTTTIVPVGAQRTRGVEFTLAGEVAKGWQVSAGYAYLDARIIKSSATSTGTSAGVPLQGKRAALTPSHGANVWVLRELGLGFSLGAGLNYSGDRYASPDNTVSLGRYVTADATLQYKTKAYDLALNLKNLGDRTYYIGHGSSNNLNIPGAPRTAELTARLRF